MAKSKKRKIEKKRVVLSVIAVLSLIGGRVFASAPGGVENGLKMWVKADKGLDCYEEGCKPESWQDQVSGISFTKNADPNNGDTVYYETKANNFNPAINFGGQTHYIGNFDPIESSATSLTLFTVGKRNSTDGDNWQCFFNASADYSWRGGGFGLCTSSSSNTDMGFWINNYSNYFVASNKPNNAMTPTIFSGVYDGASMIYFTNHYQRDSVSYNGTVGQKVHKTYLGAGSHHSYDFNGNMSETIIYDRALTEEERLKVDSYLSIKYGINLENEAADKYVDSKGNTIFDLTANDPFINSIAGLGRDDASGLDQRVSGSTNEDGIVVISTNNDFESSNINQNRPQLQDGQFLIWAHNNGGST